MKTWEANEIAATSTAMAECEMILNHLRGDDGERVDADFLRVHTVSLLQLVGEISRAQVPQVLRGDSDELSYLFRGR